MARLKKFLRPKKGRGIGYMGAKRLLSCDIGDEIEFQVPNFEIFVDAFGGGGSMSAEFLMRGKKVAYNDLDNRIYEAFKLIMTEEVDLSELIVSKDEFKKLVIDASGPIDFLKLYVNSFGNKGKTYLYADDIADVKYDLAMKIMKNEKTFKNYRRTQTYMSETQQLQQLEQLEQLQQLERLQQLQQLTFSNTDYRNFIKEQRSDNAVLYCDIPYRNTEQYRAGDFNHDGFFEFIEKEVSNFKAIFISSYNEPDLTLVKEFKKRETLSVGNLMSNAENTEKLYVVGDFELAGQTKIFDFL